MRNRYLERDGGATLEEALHAFSAADLKSLARLVAKRSPPRKAELLALLRRELGGTGIRRFWGELDETGRLAVSESLHTWDGWYQGERFRAKYGRSPSWGTLSPSQRAPKPSCLWLFLPHGRMPDELRAALRSFVPPPPAHQIESLEELPETVAIPAESGGTAAPEEVSDRVPLAARQTDDAALHELRSCLRLVAAGRVAVSAKTGRVAARGAQAIRAVLHGGDFYAEAASPDAPGPMKAFAWPLILQAAHLARVSGTRLALTPQGGKALDAPPETTLRAAWERWLGSTLLDEYNRVDAVKGQTRQGKRWMTAVGDRREAIVGALADCPAGRWIAIEEFFRFLRAAGDDFEVTRNPWKLYILERHYGNLGYAGYHDWEILQGRYCLAFLFEYAATMGIIDVAYTPPQAARADFHGQWGTDDLAYLSRYDGLRYLRLNPFGAWCLDLADTYTPAVPARRPVLRVLPNRDLVATGEALPSDEVLLLETFAERTGDVVWTLREARILEAAEKGHAVAGLRAFLGSRTVGPLPDVVVRMLDDLEARTHALDDRGPAILVGCADEAVADLLASDRRLRDLCLRAAPTTLVVSAAKASAFRRRVRELGYCLPPPGSPRGKRR